MFPALFKGSMGTNSDNRIYVLVEDFSAAINKVKRVPLGEWTAVHRRLALSTVVVVRWSNDLDAFFIMFGSIEFFVNFYSSLLVFRRKLKSVVGSMVLLYELQVLYHQSERGEMMSDLVTVVVTEGA